MRKLLILAFVAAAALFLVACGGDDDGDDASGEATPAGSGDIYEPVATSAAGGAQPTASGNTAAGDPIRVTAAEFQFNPDEVTIKAGVESTVQFVNVGATSHTFSIDDVTDSGVLDGGGNATFLTFTIDEPGEYTFYCAIHGADRMSGTLTVEEGN